MVQPIDVFFCLDELGEINGLFFQHAVADEPVYLGAGIVGHDPAQTPQISGQLTQPHLHPGHLQKLGQPFFPIHHDQRISLLQTVCGIRLFLAILDICMRNIIQLRIVHDIAPGPVIIRRACLDDGAQDKISISQIIMILQDDVAIHIRKSFCRAHICACRRIEQTARIGIQRTAALAF